MKGDCYNIMWNKISEKRCRCELEQGKPRTLLFNEFVASSLNNCDSLRTLKTLVSLCQPSPGVGSSDLETVSQILLMIELLVRALVWTEECHWTPGHHLSWNQGLDHGLQGPLACLLWSRDVHQSLQADDYETLGCDYKLSLDSGF